MWRGQNAITLFWKPLTRSSWNRSPLIVNSRNSITMSGGFPKISWICSRFWIEFLPHFLDCLFSFTRQTSTAKTMLQIDRRILIQECAFWGSRWKCVHFGGASGWTPPFLGPQIGIPIVEKFVNNSKMVEDTVKITIDHWKLMSGFPNPPSDSLPWQSKGVSYVRPKMKRPYNQKALNQGKKL